MPRNNIIKSPVELLGYNFISPEYLPQGKNEYYLRNRQNKTGIKYRKLLANEIQILVDNNNDSSNWQHILVADGFNANFVKDCKFYGLVRIGKIEEFCLSFNNLQVQIGRAHV